MSCSATLCQLGATWCNVVVAWCGLVCLVQGVMSRPPLSRGAQVESLWCMIENMTYQMKHMPEDTARFLLGGHSALLKVKATNRYFRLRRRG